METPKIREKTMSEAVWKPEVGKTAWAVRGNSVQHVEITKISGDMVWNTSKGWGEVWTVPFGLFPTAEAALASIKVYDLEGNEVVVSHDLPQKFRFVGVCRECLKNVGLDKEEQRAMQIIHDIAYKTEFTPNPEGEARLKKAQERFVGLPRIKPIPLRTIEEDKAMLAADHGIHDVNNLPKTGLDEIRGVYSKSVIKWEKGLTGYITVGNDPILQVVPNMATGKFACFIGEEKLGVEFMLPDSALDMVESEFLRRTKLGEKPTDERVESDR